MEVTNEQLINIGLNVVGYLAAGVFWIMLYTAFSRRNCETAGDKSPVRAIAAKASASDNQKPGSKQTLEFIKLSETVPSGKKSPVPKTVPDTATPSGKNRNRAEVIRLARAMLSARTPVDEIKQALPISEGELAMIKDN